MRKLPLATPLASEPDVPIIPNCAIVDPARTASDLASAASLLERVGAPAGSDLPLPRLLIVLAHPDDEVLALGARLERLPASRLLTATDGAPLNGQDAAHHGFSSLHAYRQARQDELLAALSSAGLGSQVLHQSGFTSLPVPDQTAAFHLAGLTKAVAAAILDFAPEVLLTHPYEGGHPDHDACAFAVHTALDWLRARHPDALPASLPIVEAPFYHAGPEGVMRTDAFLPEPVVPVLSRKLSAQESSRKRQRLACFKTQQETLSQFGTEQELFRLSPGYAFTQPPHPGVLFYEQFPWGVTGAQFCRLATDALYELDLPEMHIEPRSSASPLPANA